MNSAIQIAMCQKKTFTPRLPAPSKSPPTCPTCPTRQFYTVMYLKINYIYVVMGWAKCWAVLGALGGNCKKLGRLGRWGAKYQIAILKKTFF